MSDRSHTLDNSTEATNPGRVRVSKWRWFKIYPFWPSIWIVLALGIAIAGMLQGDWKALLFLPLASVAGWWVYWTKVREHFSHGCANPGIVVSVEPTLVAVPTDLGIGKEDSYPAVKVIKMNWNGRPGYPVEVGTRIATVAVYYPDKEQELPHWADFDPRPVQPLVEDPADAETVMDTFTDGDWKELESYLDHVPRPYRPGLFWMPKRAGSSVMQS